MNAPMKLQNKTTGARLRLVLADGRALGPGKADLLAAIAGSGSLTLAAAELGMSYSVFMNGLKKAAVEVDRKVLADLAVFDKPAFAKIADMAKASLGVA